MLLVVVVNWVDRLVSCVCIVVFMCLCRWVDFCVMVVMVFFIMGWMFLLVMCVLVVRFLFNVCVID